MKGRRTVDGRARGRTECCHVAECPNMMTPQLAESILEIGARELPCWRELEEVANFHDLPELASRARLVMRRTLARERQELLAHVADGASREPQSKLSKPMRRALALLSARSWVPYGEILGTLGIKTASLSRLIVRLEARGLVRRRGVGRSVEVALDAARNG
jgi:DNA-binding transcriptional ArsR family regulator